MKAVVVNYDNEKLARLCAYRVNQAISRTTFTLYDGNFLFHHCKHLDEECDPRSRNLVISGFDTIVPRSMYLDLFKVFGTVSYFEFCVQGDIPKARIEYTRATSAFAAVLCLQSTLSIETLVTTEIPLFPVAAIGPIERRGMVFSPYENVSPEMDIIVPISLSPVGIHKHDNHATLIDIDEILMQLSSSTSLYNDYQSMASEIPVSPLTPCERYFASNAMENSPTISPLCSGEGYSPSFITPSWLLLQEEFRGQYFLMCSMNSHSSEGGWRNWSSVPIEDLKHRSVEECRMGNLSFEISRKGVRERGAKRYLSKELFDNFNNGKEENQKVFLQAAKRKFVLYRNACKEAMHSSSIIRQEAFNYGTFTPIYFNVDSN